MTARFELFATDVDAVVRFYTEVLGLDVAADRGAAGDRYVALERDAVQIGVVPTTGSPSLSARRPPVGVEIVLEVDDLDAGGVDNITTVVVDA